MTDVRREIVDLLVGAIAHDVSADDFDAVFEESTVDEHAAAARVLAQSAIQRAAEQGLLLAINHHQVAYLARQGVALLWLLGEVDPTWAARGDTGARVAEL